MTTLQRTVRAGLFTGFGLAVVLAASVTTTARAGGDTIRACVNKHR